jgi:hypothetical protein
MNPLNITESTVLMLQDHVKANIALALSDLRGERADAKVTTEPPKDYFIYEAAIGYKTPCVFMIADSVDFIKSRGNNAIMADVKMRISVVVEDRNKTNLTIKAWRYQDALLKVLDQAQVVSSNNDVKIVCVVTGAAFSPVFSAEVKGGDPNVFRKEVALECDVRHFERQ